MHCDIKSLNFLITKDFVVKLSDLGEARSSADLRASEASGLPRNINWTAPELLCDGFDGVINSKADVWSLALGKFFFLQSFSTLISFSYSG